MVLNFSRFNFLFESMKLCDWFECSLNESFHFEESNELTPVGVPKGYTHLMILHTPFSSEAQQHLGIWQMVTYGEENLTSKLPNEILTFS